MCIYSFSEKKARLQGGTLRVPNRSKKQETENRKQKPRNRKHRESNHFEGPENTESPTTSRALEVVRLSDCCKEKNTRWQTTSKVLDGAFI